MRARVEVRDEPRGVLELLHDLVAVPCIDDPLDLGGGMRREDEEARGIGPDPLVLVDVDAEPRRARVVRALADHLQLLPVRLAEHGGEIPDALVDLAEERLIRRELRSATRPGLLLLHWNPPSAGALSRGLVCRPPMTGSAPATWKPGSVPVRHTSRAIHPRP